MARPGEVVIRLLGDQKGLSKTLGKAEGRLGKFGKAAGAGIAAIGAAAVVAGAALAKIGGEFDDARDTIRVGTGATGEALAGLEEDFKAVVRSVPASFGDASTAIADLNTRLGLTGEPLQDMSTQLLNLSRITKTDVSANVASTTRMLGDWSIATEDQAGALDKLYRASQSTGAGIDSLATNVVNFGSPLRQLGFSFEESLAMFGRFEKEGVNTETVMSGLRMGLKNFAQAGKEPGPALQETIEAIKNAGSAADANAIAFEVFGARAGADMAAAVREGRFDLEDYVDTIENGSDTINQAADDTTDWRESWQKISNTLKVLVEPIATRVFGKISEWAEKAFAFIGKVEEALATPGVDGTGWVAVVERIVAGFLEFRDRVTEVVQTVQGWIERVRETFQRNGDEINAGMAGVKDFLTEVWNAVVEIISVAMELIGVVIGVWIKIITGFWERFGKHIIRFLKESWNNIQQLIKGALDVIRGVLEIFIGIFTGDWKRAWEGIKKTVAGVWNMIQAIIRQALNVIRTVLGAAVAAISQVWSWAWNSIKTFFSATIGQLLQKARAGFGRVKDAVKEKLEDVVAWIKGVPGKILRALGSLGTLLYGAGKAVLQGLWDGLKQKWEDVKHWVGGLGSKIRNLKGPIEKDRVLLTAEGGAIIDGLGEGMKKSWTGVRKTLRDITGDVSDEASSELGQRDLRRPSGRGLQPAAAMAGGGGGRTIELNLSISGVVGDRREVVRWVREAIRQAEREDQ